MITVTAKVKVVSENQSGVVEEFKSITGAETRGINVSRLNSVLGKKQMPNLRPFVLGKSKLGNGDYYVKELPYFVGRELSGDLADETGAYPFANAYTIKVKSTNPIEQMLIMFDSINDGHPTSITVDGKTIVDDDMRFEIAIDSERLEHTITVDNWNKPNAPFIISSLYANANFVINNRNLLSYESTLTDRSDTKYPSYGLISNGGSLSVADYDTQILDLITQKILHSGISVEISLSNTLTGKKEPLAKMNISELTYNNTNRAVDISLKDTLEELQEINVEAISYNPLYPEPKSFKWLYDYLYGKTPKKYNMLSFEELDFETQMVLLRTYIEYPLLESDTLWNEWDKLCQACHLAIYINENGRIVCKTAGEMVYKIVTVEMGNLIRESDGYAYYELYPISSSFNVNDKIEYQKEIAYIYDIPQHSAVGYYTVRVIPNGKFAQASGQTITVKVLDL